ncbi:MAG: recombinase family protein [Oscillospiraceae bacterium]|nr:recombinase family protein [Oscillospiraceae bacterium]
MTAIYARQSVEKENSVSIVTQTELCRMRITSPDEEIRIYQDEGYSGANTERPAFQALMRDIENGLIQHVIVYKLDRISRSLTDFAGITEKFSTYQVTFTSISEDFDTSTPMGRAMLGIVMIFAQLERETIQQRVRDAFYSRMKQGFYVSGVAPIGFMKVPHFIDGIRTQKLEADPKTVPLIVFLYQQYEKPSASIGGIVKKINQDYQKFRLSAPLSNVRISRILRNPVYVRADADVYEYLKNKGAEIVDNITEFDGMRGCSVYGHAKTTGKFTDLTGDYIKLGWHEGLISSEQWLRVQKKLDKNRQIRNAGKGSYSWLSGIMKCGYCGYALTVISGQRNGKQYISCGGRKQKICYARNTVLTCRDIERMVKQKFMAYLKRYPFAEISTQDEQNKILHLKIELKQLRQKENQLTDKMLAMTDSEFTELLQQFNERLKEIHIRQKDLHQRMIQLYTQTAEHPEQKITACLENWETFSLKRKKEIIRLFIREVRVWNDKLEMIYLTEEI